MKNLRTVWVEPLFVATVLSIACVAQSSAPPSKAKFTGTSRLSSETSSQEAWRILRTAIEDHSATHRQAAVIALSTLGSQERAVRLVSSVLEDKDVAVRQAAATALGEMKSMRAIPALKQSLEDDAGTVRLAAAKSLLQMGDHSGRPVLEGILSKQSSPSEGPLKQGLDDAGKKLHNPGELARMGLNEASGAFLGPFSYGVVVAEELAKDKGAPARAISASLLASDHNPKAIRTLQDAVQDDNAGVRTAAAKALGTHACKQVLPDLQFLLDDKAPVKYMASASIIRIENSIRSGKRDAECEQLNPPLAEQTTPDLAR